jgi:hypothetical protein
MERNRMFPFSFNALVVVACLCVPFSAASEAGFNSTTIYSGGDVVRAYAIEETTITLIVLLVAAIVEFAVDTVSGAENKYLRVMFNAVAQEVMIVGVLILALLFTQTVYTWPVLWVFMFKWSMMCLFLMIVLFIIEIMVLLYIARRSADSWGVFESTLMDTQGVSLSGWQEHYKHSSYKFLQALRAYGYEAGNGVRFSHYLSKMVRRNVFSMTEIKWVAWVVLATVAVLNGLRAEAAMKLSLIGDENVDDELSDWQRFINYFTFVVLVGYVALALFIAVFVMLLRRLDAFLEGTRSAQRASSPPPASTATVVGAEVVISIDTLDDPRSYLFRHSLDATMELIQTLLLVVQWYTATFVLGFMYQCVMVVDLAYGIPVLVAGAIPFFVPMFLMPRLLLTVTILGSLGTNLDEYAVQALIKSAKVPESEWPAKMKRRLLASKKLKDKRRKSRLEPSATALDSPSGGAAALPIGEH